jgi:hypothetical protein
MENAFQDFQRAFARHLRDPQRVARPAGVPARRAAVYRSWSSTTCAASSMPVFPVGRAVLGDTAGGVWNRAFCATGPLRTPWFREIPREFVATSARPASGRRCRAGSPNWRITIWAELAVST